MAKKSKLLAALDAHKGVNHELERQKKLQKQAARRKRSKAAAKLRNGGYINEEVEADANGLEAQPQHESGLESEDASGDNLTAIDTSRLEQIDDSDSNTDDDSRFDTAAPPDGKASTDPSPNDHIIPAHSSEDSKEEDDDDDDVDEEGIPLSDIESLPSSEAADLIPHQRLTINNTPALLSSLSRISLPSSPFSLSQSLLTPSPITIPDINDDLTRELAFYSQCLTAATTARTLLQKEGIPFTRPSDYFAEMVKSDEHMGKIKAKMTDEAAGKKAAAEARRQRDLKRFGKQVQVAKLQERDKARREGLEKINVLKRKRKSSAPIAPNEEDLFDIALDTETKPSRSKSTSTNPTSNSRTNGRGNKDTNKRQKKDAKFGFGGKKRFAKSGDAQSTADMSGFSARKMKGKGSKRLGKSKRAKVG